MNDKALNNDKSAKQYKLMTETPITRLVSSLALPTVASMLVTSIYNLADTYFVSQMGTDASGAVGIVFSIQSLIQAVGFGLGMGAGSLAAQCLGAKEDKKASEYASSAFLAAVIFGILLGAACLSNLKGIMRLFGSNKDILPYACDYGFYILLAAPIMCSTFVLNVVLRSSGKAKLSMIGITSGSILNILLDPVFIFDWGLGLKTAGAAIATIIGQVISFCILLGFYVFKVSIVSISIKNISRKADTYWNIIKTGVPTVFRQGLACIATTLLNNQARVYGSYAISAMSIANRIYMVIRNIVVGIGQGYMPVAGYNYGAGKYNRVERAFKVTVTIGTIFSMAAAIFILCTAPRLMKLFRKDDLQVISTGTKALYFYCLSLPVLAYSTNVNQTLQCLSRVKSATFLASCRSGIFYVPLILLLPWCFKLTGIQLAQSAADILTFIISIPFQVVFFRNMRESFINTTG